MSSNGQSSALVKANPAALAQAEQTAAHIAAATPVIEALQRINPDLASRVLAILASQGQERPLSLDRAVSAAAWELKTGHVIGRDAYVDQKMGVLDGYRGIQMDAARAGGHYDEKYRALSAEEAAECDPPLRPGDVAVACEVTVLAAYRETLQVQELEQRLHGQISTVYHPLLGIGIVRKEEKYDCEVWDDSQRRYVLLPEEKWRPKKLSGGWSWSAKARIRAKRAALKQVAGAQVDAREILAEAAAERLALPPATAQLSAAQAEAWVAQQRQLGAVSAAPAADGDPAAVLKRNGDAMRGPANFQGFGDDDEDESMERVTAAWSERRMAAEDDGDERAPSPLDGWLSEDKRGGAPRVDPRQEIIERLRKLAANQPAPQTEQAVKKARANVSNLVGNDRHKGKALLKLLFERDSSNDLTVGECEALSQWIASRPNGQNGEWLPSMKAIEEYKTLFPSETRLLNE